MPLRLLQKILKRFYATKKVDLVIIFLFTIYTTRAII